MVKKMIAWMLLIAVTATVAVGGTLAYLTDRDSEANVFTTGDVKIDLEEDFQQGAELLPGVEIEKKPTITNTGENAAWVWYTYAIPEALDGDLTLKFAENSGWADPVDTGKTVELEGVRYKLYKVLYQQTLAPGAETSESLTSVTLPAYVDITPEGQLYKVEAGVTTDLGWNINSGNPVIYISAYAIQDEGFENVDDAYNAYQTQWGDNGGEYPKVPNLLDTTEELMEAVQTNKNHVVAENINLPSYAIANDAGIDSTINLNDYTVTVDGVPGVARSGIGFIAQNGADLVFNGPGCVDMRYVSQDGKKPEYCSPFYANKSATITVNGGKYLMGVCDKTYHIYCQNSAKIIINDGEFITSNPNAAIAYCINGFIEINGGFFQNTANPNQPLLSMGNNKNYVNNQKITISGGTFVNWNPMSSAYAVPWPDMNIPALIVLGEGCTVVSETQANGDIWYTVVKG